MTLPFMTPGSLRLAAASIALNVAAMAVAATGAVLERVEVSREADRYLLAGEILIQAPRSAVYAVIIDFDRLAELDHGIVESHIVERIDEKTTLVYTKMNGCVMVFCRDVERLERVEQLSDTEIIANLVPDEQSDIRSSTSRWLLSSEGDATRVVYTTEIDPTFWVPPLIGTALVRKVLRDRVTATLGNLEQAALERGPG